MTRQRRFSVHAAERVVADMDLAKREEVEALKTLARSALERAETLEKRVAELEAKLERTVLKPILISKPLTTPPLWDAPTLYSV